MIPNSDIPQNSETHTMEQLLIKNQEKLKCYIDKSPDGVFVINTRGYYIDVNSAGCEMLGYSRQELLKLHISDIDTNLQDIDHFNELRPSGEVIDDERTLRRKDGKEIIVHIKSVSLGDDLLISYVRDITNRRLTEKALIETERKFKLYVDKSPDGIFVADSEGRYVDVNPAACMLLGYTRDELLKLSIRDVATLEDGIKNFERLKNIGEMITEERKLIRKDGSLIDVEIRASVLGNGLYMAYVTDITERKIAEIRLRESETLFSKTFHSNPNALAVTTFPDGRYIDVNESFLRMHEYSREEVIGRTSYELKIWANSQQRKELIKMIEADGKVQNYDIELYTKTGKILKGLFSLEMIEFNGQICNLGCFTDLTEKINIEQEIIRLDRLNLIGEMSASIGHEVRNPMTTVRGFLQLLGNEETDSRKKQYYEIMIDELDRANSIITEFLSLAKDKAVKLQPKSLNTVINTLYPLLSSDAIKQDKRIVLNKGDIPNIPLDDKEMRQLIINLVKNGLESMHPGGILTIGTYSINNEVVLFVEDEGSGISPDLLDKLGNPFLTTKETGTGLGLAVCYSIANRHNAAIDVKTGSSGTIFNVRFKLPHSKTTEQVS